MRLLLALAALLVAGPAFAQAPDRLGEPTLDHPEADVVAAMANATSAFAFRGVLRDGGQPVPDGTYTIQVRLHSLPTNILVLYAEDHTVQTEGGQFDLLIGGGTFVSGNFASVNFSEAVYVEIEVDGTRLLPRTEIRPAPFALTLRAGAAVEGDMQSTFRALNTAPTRLAYGVYAESASGGGIAVAGVATSASGTTYGGRFESASTAGHGVIGLATATSGTNYGVYGYTGSTKGYAGYFVGGRGVYTDGAYLSSGADLAEYFPLAPAASVQPGDLVGLRGGRVSLDTEAAEQVMVASSDPAFVGNPDAEAGGALVALVGQAEVRLSGPASVGDLLVASGYDDGTARAVAPARYDPEADGSVAGRVLSAEGGRALALVGVDEAAALRAVVARQQSVIDAQAARLDAQRALIDAQAREAEALRADLDAVLARLGIADRSTGFAPAAATNR